MEMENNNKEAFEEWLNNLSKSYRTYLNNVVSMKDENNSSRERDASQEMRKFVIDNNIKYPIIDDFRKIISDFLMNNDSLYAQSYSDLIKNYIKNCWTLTKVTDDVDEKLKKDFDNSYRVLRKLSDKLQELRISCNSNGDEFDVRRNNISKAKIHKIDGIDGLIQVLQIDKFVKMAVEQSYFFDPKLVIERQGELSELFCEKKEGIPARKTSITIPLHVDDDKMKKLLSNIKTETGLEISDMEAAKMYLGYWHEERENDKFFYCENNLTIPIARDKDGNRNVRKIIKDKTGYTVCEGRSSIFQNYIISHIWGRAFDPRYFTSLWNIVLIPAWANGLMDKPDPEENTPASVLQSTFKAICKELYFKKLEEEYKKGSKKWWDAIDIEKCPELSCPNDVKTEDFLINIIEMKSQEDKKRTSIVSKIISNNCKIQKHS